jgi:hypothetical protein
VSIGVCKLCLEEKKELQESHYIPAAIYPKNATLEFSSPISVSIVEDHITSPLLCRECEQLFNRNGESEVLLRIAPKLAKKSFPLHERMRLALPREDHPEIKRFAGYEVDCDMDKFGYFMLSLVWRGAVHQWKKPDGELTRLLPLGGFTEDIRRYLLGTAPFPSDTAVIVIVCSDELSRKAWFAPGDFVEQHCLNFRFHAMGVTFRAMMGRHLPQFFRDQCCTSARKCIFYGDCERKTREAFDTMEAARARGPADCQ